MLLGLLAVLAGCGAEPKRAAPPDAVLSANGCPADAASALEGALYGAVEGSASEGTLRCEGMTRPADAGVRLRFEQQRTDGATLVFIIGIDALQAGDTGSGIRSTLTIIDEQGQRFFSTGDRDSCYSDVSRHRYLAGQRLSLIDGVLWCTAAIPAINGASSIRLTELKFAGTVRWPAPAT